PRANHDHTRERKQKNNGRWDWLAGPRPDNLSPFQKFVLDGVDWTASPLGPIAQWPIQLKQVVFAIERDTQPAVVFWGELMTIVYNEAYSQLIGNSHPKLQGNDPRIDCKGLWPQFEKLLVKQRMDAETVINDDALVMIDRHNFLEETYFSWKFIPLLGVDGSVSGSYVTVVETTREVLFERRSAIARSLSRELARTGTTTENIWRRIIAGLADAGRDMTSAAVYSLRSADGTSVGASTCKEFRHEAGTGIIQGHELVPAVDIMNDCGPTSLEIPIRKSIESRKIEVGPLPKFEQPVAWRDDIIPTDFASCPIISTDTDELLAVLVLALNPGRPFDGEYRNFIEMLIQQIITPQVTAIMTGERRQTIERQEIIHREKLLKELSKSESNLARITTRVPFGMAILNIDGSPVTANQHWQDLTTLSLESSIADWGSVLEPGELDIALESWDRVCTRGEAVTFQIAVNRPWRPAGADVDADDEEHNCTHIIFTTFPNFDENGKVATVMSYLTDISEIKWSERQLRKRMEQAIEMKLQQERFIDMTSHEMRNPLSALIGCADEIIAALRDYRMTIQSPNFWPLPPSPTHERNERQPYVEPLEECIESAKTIIYCAMHQKRIIDDILTLSRLDSNLLPVYPKPSQPIHLIRSAMKMFDNELRHAAIEFEFIEEATIQTLGVHWTLLDPSRVLQVLINLMTNAIKFTRSLPNARIQINVGASLQLPSETNEHGVEYVAKSKNSSNQDQTGKAEWGDGEIIYLSVTVKDTGCGLSREQKTKLFRLFQQGSPRTHIQYGGSGLGLFISRQLVEMQGGQFGVVSELGKGSTFHFYIKTRRTHPPKSEDLGSANNDIQLMMSQDALREACGVQISPAQEVVEDKMSKLEIGKVPAESSRKASTKPNPSYNILVVEDNLVNQKVVTKQLRKAGHTVSVANQGEEAMEFIQRSEYWAPSTSSGDGTREKLDVVLMDLEMPILDGLSCVKRIRRLQREGQIIRHVPVIAVTANARKDQILNCIEAGMDDVTTKPYRMKDMLQQIDALMAKDFSSEK
ncbi:hypothetical protein HYFRA_00007605, partial [Hymenoscyphus fraxineus]